MTSLQELEQRIAKNPRSLLFARLADSYLKEGRIDEAVEVCTAGLQHCPSYTTGHYILAKAYLARGETDKAETALKKVISHDRQYLSAHKHLGDIMARAGWESKAAVHYRDLLTIDPLEHEAGEMLRSFSIDEPLRETGFHETVPSRSAEELRLNEKTTGINRKDWEEEFDELFRETKTAEEETDQIETETETASFDLDDDMDNDTVTDDVRPEKSGQDQAPPAEPPEEYIDIEAFRPPSVQRPAAGSAGDIDLEDPDLEDLAAPEDTAGTGSAPADDTEVPEGSEGILLDISLDDLEGIDDMKPAASAEDEEPSPDIAGDLDDEDMDLGAFEEDTETPRDTFGDVEETEPDASAENEEPSPDIAGDLDDEDMDLGAFEEDTETPRDTFGDVEETEPAASAENEEPSPDIAGDLDDEDMDLGAFEEDTETPQESNAGAEITADSGFDDLDDSAFDKLDELFSREDELPAGSSTTETIGASLFEKEEPGGEDRSTRIESGGASGSEEPPVHGDAEPSWPPETENDTAESGPALTADNGIHDEKDPSELIAEINPADFDDDDLPLIADEQEEEDTSADEQEEEDTSADEPDLDVTQASDRKPAPAEDPGFSASEAAPETVPGAASGGSDTGQRIVSPTLGEIYAAQGQYAKALKVFETLHAKNPDNELYSRKIEEMKHKLAEE